MAEPEWISPREASKRLDVSDVRIQQLLRSGRIRSMQTPIGRLVDASSVEAYRLNRKVVA